ncbi:MAG: hypothetical protein JWN62_80, partial [Acidimicrobiales bacterium]|nr:hypothetical protein [Acidimicrobiales bacterium]
MASSKFSLRVFDTDRQPAGEQVVPVPTDCFLPTEAEGVRVPHFVGRLTTTVPTGHGLPCVVNVEPLRHLGEFRTSRMSSTRG